MGDNEITKQLKPQKLSKLPTDLYEISGANIDEDFIGIIERARNVQRSCKRHEHFLS